MHVPRRIPTNSFFQYDIQFAVGPHANPDFFLREKWGDFNQCLSLFLGELHPVKTHLYGNADHLNNEQLCYVAVGYNVGAGRVHPNADFRTQGHDGYGGNIYDFMQLAKTVADPTCSSA
jgi:hypothetical protein